MQGAARTVIGVVLALLALPASASAQAVISRDLTAMPPRITYTGEAAAPNTVGVSFVLDGVFFARAGGTITAGADCAATSCPWSAEVARIDLLGAELDDSFALTDLRQGLAVAVPVLVDGGAGADRVVGTPGPEQFGGGPGDDRLETLSARDELIGGDGDDRLVLGADGTTVSLDGVANDGPGGSANVHADVERVEGGAGADTLTAFAGAQVLSGGGGADVIDPGPGADTVQGGPGADTIRVRDGAVDQVDCGGDAGDRVDADAADVLVNCPADPPPPPPPPPARAPAPPPAAAPAPPAEPPAPTRLRATIGARWRVGKRTTRLTRLRVRGAPAGARLQVRCAGGGCPFARDRVALERGGARLTRRFAGRRLRPGAVVELRITAPGRIGKLERLEIRRRRDLRRVVLCLPPGGGKPTRC